MLLGKKKDLLAEKDNSGTPASSRKVRSFFLSSFLLFFCFLKKDSPCPCGGSRYRVPSYALTFILSRGQIVPFNKFVTAKDQIELVERDIEGGASLQRPASSLCGAV